MDNEPNSRDMIAALAGEILVLKEQVRALEARLVKDDEKDFLIFNAYSALKAWYDNDKDTGTGNHI